ncbi:MAG TPA: methyltransferase domain-containing protein [Planctomycetota bacterium]
MTPPQHRPEWWSLLACPQCKSPLRDHGERLQCTTCSAGFVCRGDVVQFLAADHPVRRQLATPDGSSMVRGYRRPARAVKALRRIVSSEFSPGRAWRRARSEVVAGPRPLLVIGSGVQRIPGALHLDVDDFPGVDVVADAHRLPIADGSLAGVLCEVVFEHLAEPARVVAETMRTLAPGGRFYFTVPFLFPYHGHPGDYRRWSRQGLETKFAAFDDVRTGIHAGPCSAMVNVMSEWAYVASGCRYPRGYVLIKGLATAILFPLKFGDLLLQHFPEAHRLASTLFVTGRKPGHAPVATPAAVTGAS